LGRILTKSAFRCNYFSVCNKNCYDKLGVDPGLDISNSNFI
jgi:hypothetical protein